MENEEILNYTFNPGDVLTADQLNKIVGVISTLVDKIEELETKINGLTDE